ncbi:MAG: cytochrome c biogenesis protein ResB, partial [Planctomycetes bacterium]|nr:cytochrome c biogenesis protein ResB [Planctomycetota bacterium]
MRRMVIGFWRWLASLELAVILLVVLAAVLAWATIVEARQGAEYAQWYFYYSQWFIWVLGLLSANVLAATLIRLPWKRSQTGFVIAHVGVLVLMGGSLLTFLRGIDGQLSFAEGETADSILLAHRTQLTVIGPGGSDRSPIKFSFSTGPVDWGRDDPLDFGRTDGIGLRVLEFYHQARGEVEWVADDSMRGEPALKLAAGGAHGAAGKPLWCVADPFGSQAAQSEVGFEFRRAAAASMKEDFLNPPPVHELPEQGLLVAHWRGKTYEIAVGDNVSKKVPLGEGGPSVVIAAYHANAVSEGGGRFTSRGTAPENPMLQLEIHLPQSEDPISEIAYARNSFVSYDLMRAEESPVKFWYHHPSVPARPGVEFLETPDGKLYCRLGTGSRYEPRGEVKVGDSVEVVSGLDVSILDYLPHARQEITFQPAELSGATKVRLESAALVEVSFGGKTHEIWLRRSQQPDGFETIETERGPVRLNLGYERAPLGFSLKLIDFKRGMNPGRMGNASFASKVQLVDKAEGIDRQREISMNRPLAHGKYTFYQSSFSEMPDGTALSVLSAAHDPGRLLKYLGSVMLCVGIFIVYYMKSVFRTSRRPDAGPGKKTSNASSGKGKRGVSRKATGVLVAWLALGASAFAESRSGADFDWGPWRHLPVLDGGRRKPLDTLARETLQELTGDRSFRDPRSGAKLSPTAMYLEMLFDWQGWDGPADPHAGAGLGAIGVYYASHEPDKWDRADLFPVNNSALRKALGMAKGDRRISPLKLSQAEIRDPRTDQETPFLSWAAERYSEDSENTSTLEKGGLELVNKLLSYHAHRMGERL